MFLRNQFYWRKRMALLLIVALVFGSFSGGIAPLKADAAPGNVLPSWADKAVLWLKADAGVTPATSDPASTLTGWEDQTGTVGFQVYGTPGYRAGGVNFNPVVTFSNKDALNGYLSGKQKVNYADGYAVFKGSGTVVGSVYNLSNYGAAVFGSQDNKLYVGNGTNYTYYQYSFNTGISKASHHLAGYDISTGSKKSKADVSVNGKSGEASLNNGSYPVPASLEFAPMIGGTSSGWSNYDGEIAEVILFSESTAANRSKIESYLALKYGITLNGGQSDYVDSAGSPFWSKEANVGYGNRITGIGKDSGSGLEQKQSKSQDNGALVTIAAGTEILASNKEFASGSIVNDTSFLMFGDNNGATTYSKDVDNSNLKRMERVFKFAKTNWADREITLQLDGIGTKPTYLVISDNSGFTGTTAAFPLDATGKVTINSDALKDGSYFTFAEGERITNAPGGVSGASLWLKADKDAAAAGGQLTGWIDQTNTNQFTIVGTPEYKTGAVNFNPAVTFENTAKASQNPNEVLIGSKEIRFKEGYAVFKQRAGTVVGSAAPRPGGYGAGLFAGWSNKLWIGNGALVTYHGFPFRDASRYHLTGFDLANSGDSQGRLDGAPQPMTRNKTFNEITFTPVIGGTFGGGSTNNWDHYKGDVAEVVLFPASKTELEKQRVESYLALKYGLTLNKGKTDYVTSNGSDKIWTASSNAGYGNRITGIGRDNGSNLLQKQSKSQEEGALVTIALGNEIKATNAENTNSVADLSFFAFSDNGGTIKYDDVIKENQQTQQHDLKLMKREFKVEKTNWQDADITLKLDTAADTPAVRYYLVIRDAAGTTTELIPLNTAGEATIDSSKLANGSLFSFAKVNKDKLQVNISGVQGLTKESYTPESWTALQNALTSAAAVLANPNATQEEVDAALAALEAARQGLESTYAKLQAKADEIKGELDLGSLKEGDYTAESWEQLTTALSEANALLKKTPSATPSELGQTLSKLEMARKTLVDLSQLRDKEAEITAEKLPADGYTQASWQALQDALTNARNVLAKPNATQAEVDAAKDALIAARAALEAVGKDALQAKVDNINSEGLAEASFTPESWAALQQALANAAAVLNDPNATQAEVDAALATLEAARAGLVPVDAGVNKAALQAKADEIHSEGLAEANFTPESWQALQKALAEAKAVLSNPNATQAEVDAALAALVAARNQLNRSDAVLGKLDVVDSKNGNPIALSPVFDGNKSLNYEAVVSNAVYGVGIAPQALNPNSKITVTLNGQEVNAAAWDNLPLKEGRNVIQVEVTDPNGKKNSYMIEILRVSSKLASLTPSTGSLNPAFDPDKEAYTMSVPNSVYQLGWTPVALDPNAIIEISVNGGAFTALTNGKASPDYALNVGANTIVVKVTDRNGEVKQYTITVTRASDSTTSSGNGGGSYWGGGVASNPAGIETSVNGKDASFATGTTEQSDGRTRTTIQVDAGKLNDLLSQGQGQKLAIRIPKEGDVRVDGLTAEMVKRLADTGSSLEISSLLAIYPVPGKQLDLDAIAKQWNHAALGDIAVHVDIKRSSAAQIESARSKATAEGYELLVDPVDLDLTFTREGRTVRAGQLSGYAAKYIALPEGIDPNRITTGVIVNPDGTVFHVPTVVTKMNNRYFALINDLRSHGTYSVIWNPQDFDDVKNHWARAEVNNIAARLDLAGTGNNTWSPDRSVNRSEFAAIVVSGLGLMRQDAPQSTFHDVSSSAWHHHAVTIANEFGIVLGYEDSSFRPEQQITREQGIAMIARAYRVIDPQKTIAPGEQDSQLSSFGDAKYVSSWAKEAVAMMVAAGIVEGKDGQLLKPQDSMTRAETAALIQRLLKTTHLID
ncbi:cadherin-like beta sandwich domain-containing protein [Paenibacillus ehimensis]|uniref:cadherin-like beta sandwich domain-containing protein n=1 Tax=Paenibacillus ehimensis TaxID=79264 RepID=UPI000ABC6337|nr:cadherin-like beta sandwich domain-containing protein [Paenibacillus ehimensis]